MKGSPEMSNLKLPVMNFGNLSRLAGERYQKKVAHNTTATVEGNSVQVHYHGNHIADIFEGSVWLSTAGWSTQTTVARLNAILTDTLPMTPYRS